MALRARQVPIFVSGGIDTKTDPRVIPPGSLIEIENMYYQRTGELRLRNGYSAIPTTAIVGTSGAGTISNIRSLFADQNGNLSAIATVLGVSGLVVFSSIENKWSGYGQLPTPSATASVTGIASGIRFSATIGDLLDCDSCVAIFGGKQAMLSCWTEGAAGVRFAMSDLTSAILLPVQSTAVTKSRAVANGQYACVVQVNGSVPPDLVASVVDVSTLQVATYTLAANSVLAAAPWIEVIPRPAASTIIVAYRANAGGTSILEFNPATGAVVAGPTNIAAADSSMALCLLDDQQSSGSYWLATVGATSGVVVRKLTTAFAVSATNVIDATATANIRNMTGYLTSSANFAVLWDVDATPTNNSLIRQGTWTGSAAVVIVNRSVALASKTFLYNGSRYFIGVYDSTVQGVYVMFGDGSPGLPGAPHPINGTFLSGTAGGKTNSPNRLASIAAIGGSIFAGSILKKTKLTVTNGVVSPLRSVARITFEMNSPVFRPREIGGTMFFPGGAPYISDGSTELYIVPPLAPEIVDAVGGSGGAMTSSGAYSYVDVYKFIAADGRISRSPPSVPKAVTLGGADTSALVTSANLRIGGFNATTVPVCVIEHYRSGPAATGATGYSKVGESVPNFYNNDTTVFADLVSDAVAATGEPLYTTGGALENFLPPSSSLLTVAALRIWIVNSEYPSELWYSKECKQGAVAGFHPLQTLHLEGDGYGPITALAAMDGRLIAFKSNAIYVISGDGPNDLGQGTFNPPQAVSLNVGTVLPGSVVATPDGIMFQAAAGMFLLTRGLSVTYVGKPVEQYTLAANVVDASRVSGTTQIRFVMANGRCLVWDYGVVGAPQPGVQAPPGMWTTFLLAVGGSTVVACADAPGGWCYALANGTVNQETPGVFTDPGNLAIVPRVGFPHLALANIAGFQRVQGIEILGEFVGNHTLSAQFEYDYSGGVTETRSKAITAGAYLYGVLTAKQKCTALKLTLTTSVQAAGSGAFRLTGVNLLVAGKAGQFTLPPASFLT